MNFLVDSANGPIQPTSSLSQSIGAPFASASGGTTVVGVGICAAYGWAPAYLWAIFASVFGGGLFACASFWLVRQYPTRGASEIIAALLGRSSLGLFYIVLGMVLCLLAPLLALAAGEMMAANGSAAVAVLVTVLIVLIGSRLPSLHGFIPIFCISSSVIVISLGGEFGFGLQGYLSVSVGEHNTVFPARAIWVLLVAVLCGWVAERSRHNSAMATMIGSSASIGLLLVIGSVLTGLIMVNPPIVAPAFVESGHFLQIMPLLAILMTGGALSSFHAFVNDPESGSLRGNGLQIAYARAALDGLLAVTVILVTATIGASQEEWLATVGAVDTRSPIHLWLAQFAIGVSLMAPALGIEPEFARNLISYAMILATLSALERCFRVLHYLLSEVVASTPANKIPLSRRWLYIAAGVFAFALLFKHHGLGYELWPIIGAASQIFAGTILGVVIINLKRKAKPTRVILTVCATLWVLVLVACAISFYIWFTQSQFVYLIPWGMLLVIGSSLAMRLAWRLRKVRLLSDSQVTHTVTQEMSSNSA